MADLDSIFHPIGSFLYLKFMIHKKHILVYKNMLLELSIPHKTSFCHRINIEFYASVTIYTVHVSLHPGNKKVLPLHIKCFIARLKPYTYFISSVDCRQRFGSWYRRICIGDSLSFYRHSECVGGIK